jgi:hypothetical protein
MKIVSSASIDLALINCSSSSRSSSFSGASLDFFDFVGAISSVTRLNWRLTWIDRPSRERSEGFSPQISPARIAVFRAKRSIETEKHFFRRLELNQNYLVLQHSIQNMRGATFLSLKAVGFPWKRQHLVVEGI